MQASLQSGHPKSRTIIIPQNQYFFEKGVLQVQQVNTGLNFHKIPRFLFISSLIPCTTMPINQLPEALGMERVLELAWRHIVASENSAGERYRKEIQAREAEEEFQSALALLQPIFLTPQQMIVSLITGVVLPEGMERQRLLNFAGKWKQRERVAATVHEERRAAQNDVVGMLVHCSKAGNNRGRTPEQVAQRRRDKKCRNR